jgi:hypothetical protein
MEKSPKLFVQYHHDITYLLFYFFILFFKWFTVIIGGPAGKKKLAQPEITQLGIQSLTQSKRQRTATTKTSSSEAVQPTKFFLFFFLLFGIIIFFRIPIFQDANIILNPPVQKWCPLTHDYIYTHVIKERIINYKDFVRNFDHTQVHFMA